jgi:hypothetical protein
VRADVHLYLAESNAQKRQEWIAALDKIESLNPCAVVAAHKRPDNDDNPWAIEETRQYDRDFDRPAETTRTAEELYDKMLDGTGKGTALEESGAVSFLLQPRRRASIFGLGRFVSKSKHEIGRRHHPNDRAPMRPPHGRDTGDTCHVRLFDERVDHRRKLPLVPGGFHV